MRFDPTTKETDKMKRTGTFTLVPFGGLANRMYAIASAYCTCQTNGSRLSVVWFREWGMKADFCDIFEPWTEDKAAIREANPTDYIVNDRPRQRNFYAPKLVQRLVYDRRIYEDCVSQLRDEGFDFAGWSRGKRCYLVTCVRFATIPAEIWHKLFRPVKPVMDAVEANCSRFSSYTIGMHIRRSDNREAIKESPTHLFVETGKREIILHPDLKIFLATDSDEVKKEMRDAFGDRIITAEAPASRESISGIRDGLVDLYTLSRTNHIYGSWSSSFSRMAARIGNLELTVLTVNG